jgi:hypothetical protein
MNYHDWHLFTRISVPGCKAPYLWFLYKAMTAIKEPLALITTQDYLLPCTKWQEEGRWEVTDDGQKRLGYELPNFSVRQKTTSILLMKNHYLKH